MWKGYTNSVGISIVYKLNMDFNVYIQKSLLVTCFIIVILLILNKDLLND
jgi:hypothetical protein